MTGADVVVIGAGAAGIAAARLLHDAGRDVLLLEAKERIGGRAHSIRLASLALDACHDDRLTTASSRATALDLGCGWLHSAGRNPWVAIAERDGFAVDRAPSNWRQQWRDLGFSPADRREANAAFARWSDAAHAALGGPDRPLSDFVVANDRWYPMIEAISGYANGASLANVSLHDWAAYEDASTDDNWTLPAGYGTLVANHARGVPLRLDTAVTRIDHRGMRIRVETSAGTIETRAVVVCLPTTAYASLVFDPPLPAKQDAAAALPLGLADKAFLLVDGPEWPTDAHLIGDPFATCTASHRLSPFGLPVIESFFGDSCAQRLEDERAACAFAIDELVALLGSDWRRRLTPLRATRWRDEAHIHGSYSHARIGHAPAREVLAETVEDRLFFAGEACHPRDFSTAHGAYETGIAAARALLTAASAAA